MEERAPLLVDSEQDVPVEDISDVQVAFKQQTSSSAGLPEPSEPEVQPSGSSQPPSSVSVGHTGRRKRKQYSGNELIVAIFVVQFDIRKGNVVEWKYPEEVDLEGIEFKCIASGSHNIPKDFIYFKQGQLFGLSCFEKILIQSESERGVRMKSVGLLAVGYPDLHLHQQFLQKQARVQVESPGSYSSLQEYFSHSQSLRHTTAVPKPLSNSQHHMGANNLSNTEVTHPPGCFAQFLEFFGPHVFVLWKLAMLKKRIIIYSPPPIGAVCHRVYCTCLLTDHCLDLDTECNPMFYVNVNDIDVLSGTSHYIACTSEQILQHKTELYDVFVDKDRVVSHLASMDPILRLTPADRERYDLLNNISRSNQLISSGGVGNTQCDEHRFTVFFQELNSQLLRTMQEAAGFEDHLLTVEMVESVGLDPLRDRLFLTELASLLSFNLNLQRRSDMMDLLSCCC